VFEIASGCIESVKCGIQIPLGREAQEPPIRGVIAERTEAVWLAEAFPLNRRSNLEDCMSNNKHDSPKTEKGKIGYVILYFLGAPIGLLLILWLILGDNLIGPG
jgi:hypothetical protein